MSSFGDPSARRKLAEMKHTLALARVARDDVRTAYAASLKRLELARVELETILRRGELARQIDDPETVQVAERFAESQRSSIAVLERKVAVQHEELVLAERTVTEMETELRATTGIGPTPGATADRPDASDPSDVHPSDFRALDDAARAQVAEDRLAELKRRMGRS